MNVTYIYHSGYLVETEPATLLFDYDQGKLPAFPGDKPLIIFASHKHRDHFNLKIFDWKDHPGGAIYVFGNDIKLSGNYLERHGVSPSVKEKIHKMAPHTVLKLGEITIYTLRSTDAGAAFYVDTGRERIYHAGDLNWWHWEGEADSFNRDQEQRYQEEIRYLKKLLEGGGKQPLPLDAAFIPLDPRLGEAYCYGMDWFLSQIPVKAAYPMHMWEDYGVIDRYLEHCAGSKNRKEFAALVKNPLKG